MDVRARTKLAGLMSALAKETDLQAAEKLRREVALAEAALRIVERIESRKDEH